MRADGAAELTADTVVTCTGGTPTANGGQIPLFTFSLTTAANVEVTSRLLSTTVSPPTTEVLAFLDEPGPANQFLCTTTSGVCPGFGNGTGTNYYGNGAQSAGNPNNRNVFQGVLLSGNIVQFTIPFDPPGTGQRVIRFVNLRTGLTRLGIQVGQTADVNVTVAAQNQNNANFPIVNPVVKVGTALHGVEASLRNAANNSAMPNIAIDTAAAGNQVRVATFRFTERFPTAFKRRTTAFPLGVNFSPPPQSQDTLGQVYATESGFLKTSFPTVVGRGNLGQAGLASQGLRIMARIDQIPVGATIFVRSTPVIAGNPNGLVRLINANTDGSGNFSTRGAANALVEIQPSVGEALAVWEILNADTTVIEEMDIDVYASWPAGLNWTVPSRVFFSLGPLTPVLNASAIDPTPRFGAIIGGGGGGGCTFIVTGWQNAVPLEGGTIDIAVDTQPGCDWTAVTNSPLLVVESYSPANHIGSGSVRLRAPFNPSGTRVTPVTIANTTSVNVTQLGGLPGISPPVIVAPVLNQIVQAKAITLRAFSRIIKKLHANPPTENG
ncbi:MAG: hypothetical protein FJW39_33400 [Acidobacteria bacterium]|nr:hypothetical protein [Acidobacteriota bacterium]